MRTIRFAPIVTAGALSIGLAVHAHAALVDFNTPGDLTSRFALNHNGFGVKYTQVATGGLGNSGAVDLLATVDADHTTAVFTDHNYSFATAGNAITVSQFGLRQTATAAQTPFLQIGIVSDTSERMDGGTSSNSYTSIKINPESAALGSLASFQIESKVTGGGRTRVTPGISATLTAGNWYRASATFTNLSATQISVSAILEDWGTTGAAFVSTAMTLPTTIVNLSGTDQVNGDSTVWAAFRDFNEGGMNIIDNFSVTPEPTTGLVLVLAAAALRRR